MENKNQRLRQHMLCFSLDEPHLGGTLEPALLQFMENTLHSMTEKHQETHDSVNKGCGALLTLTSQAIINYIKNGLLHPVETAEEIAALVLVVQFVIEFLYVTGYKAMSMKTQLCTIFTV